MNHKRQQGFSLIELMAVVVVLAILASVAYPSYQDHVRKARRSAVQQYMLDIANRQEQYMLDARSYTTTLGSGGLNLTVPEAVDPYYDVTLSNTDGYTITATAKGAQAGQPTLTLNALGEKTPADQWK